MIHIFFKKDISAEVGIHVEDDQEFLSKHKEELDVEKEKEKANKETKQPPSAPIDTTSSPLQRLIPNIGGPPTVRTQKKIISFH